MEALETLLDQLDESRAQLLMAIETLPDDALLTDGAIGSWSIADLLLILTAWESEMVTGLRHLSQNKKPEKLLTALSRREAYNDKLIRQCTEKDLDVIFDDFQRARATLETWLESFSEKKLTHPRAYKWLRGKSLQQLIQETTFGYEAQYIPALQAFATDWHNRDETAVSPSTPFIPLSAVNQTPPEEQPHDQSN